MNRWLMKALVFAVLVVLATMAWMPYAAAALVTDPSVLTQPAAGFGETMLEPERTVPWQWPVKNEPNAHMRDNLLARDTTSNTSSPTSGGSSTSTQSAVVMIIHLPPPPLLARLTPASSTIFPDPPPFKVVHVPRHTLLLA